MAKSLRKGHVIANAEIDFCIRHRNVKVICTGYKCWFQISNFRIGDQKLTNSLLEEAIGVLRIIGVQDEMCVGNLYISTL